MIATVYDTKHAIAMTADNGAEILMHIGLDTVQLEGAWNVGIKDYKAHVMDSFATQRHVLSITENM